MKPFYIFKSFVYYNKFTFIRSIKKGKFLDIGCGNNSPSITKSLNRTLYYIGVDIDKYNVTDSDIEVCDEIHFFERNSFFEDVSSLEHKFDYIMCAHVIEHLPNVQKLFTLIENKLESGGVCFLSTPNIITVNFPSTKNTLNYYDDSTHQSMPITFETIYNHCKSSDLKIIKYKLRNTSVLGSFLGFCLEPLRILLKRTLPFTWCYWGFEDIYIIKK